MLLFVSRCEKGQKGNIYNNVWPNLFQGEEREKELNHHHHEMVSCSKEEKILLTTVILPV